MVDSIRNAQNDRLYANVEKTDVSADRLVKETVCFPKKVMVSAAVSKLGKTSIIFVDPGMKINKETYQNHLRKSMILQMK